MKNMGIVTAVFVSAILLFGGVTDAGAADITATFTADNRYDFFVSTSESAFGNYIGSSFTYDNSEEVYPYDWETPNTWNIGLTPGVTNYLHVRVSDYHVVGGLLGNFTLNTANFLFENGTNYLLTDARYWKIYTDTFGGIQSVLHDWGRNDDNGTIWSWVHGGPMAGINGAANWIWDDQGGAPNVRYLSTKIIPTPEPISSALFILGGGAIAVLKLRKKKS